MDKPVVPAVPAVRWKAKALGIDLALVAGSGPGGLILMRDLQRIIAPRLNQGPQASPLARKLANALGISLEDVPRESGSSRIMLADVIGAARDLLRARQDVSSVPSSKTVPLDSMRRTIARRMSQSAQTAPHIHLYVDVDMGSLEKVREELLPLVEQRTGVRLSINDLLIKATAVTLRDFPLLNATIREDEILMFEEINVGIAVALPEGLLVPAIPWADKMGIAQIAKMRRDLVERARTNRLKPHELERGTFTISSLSRYEVIFFTAILKPPQTGLLTVGNTRTEPLPHGEGLVWRRMCRFGLTADHRVVDGATGAEFLQALKRRLEKPGSFLFHIE